jgi:hypothetical protein
MVSRANDAEEPLRTGQRGPQQCPAPSSSTHTSARQRSQLDGSANRYRRLRSAKASSRNVVLRAERTRIRRAPLPLLLDDLLLSRGVGARYWPPQPWTATTRCGNPSLLLGGYRWGRIHALPAELTALGGNSGRSMWAVATSEAYNRVRQLVAETGKGEPPPQNLQPVVEFVACRDRRSGIPRVSDDHHNQHSRISCTLAASRACTDRARARVATQVLRVATLQQQTPAFEAYRLR